MDEATKVREGRLTRRALVFAVVLAAMFGPMTWAILDHLAGAGDAWHPAGMSACTTEDDPGPCYWDADARGNHAGRSFYVLGGVQYFRDGETREANR